MTAALIGALAVAAVSTMGDFVWATWIPRHLPIYGLIHGTLLFLGIGLYLGALERKPLPGAGGGALIGLLAAGSFYTLAPIAGYAIMFVVWGSLWVALAVLARRVLPAWGHGSWPEALARGFAAALGSGVAFYLISGIWRPFNPAGWDYAVHFLSWMVAYLPGFVALLAPARRTRHRQATETADRRSRRAEES